VQACYPRAVGGTSPINMASTLVDLESSSDEWVDDYGASIDCESNPNPGAADGAAISVESNGGAADGAAISAESNTEPPKFPYVTCDTDGCGRSEHWRLMYSKRVYDGHEDDEYTFSHQCWECSARRRT